MNYVDSLNLFGVEAKEIPCIKHSGAPTTATAGAVGMLYMDTDNGDMYKCTAVADGVYTWKETGANGKPGDPGYTPVRGVDYWTEEDIAAIDADVATELAKRGQLKPEFANSVDECTDAAKLYVLPDGYVYAYMGCSNEGVSYTNIADPSSSDWTADSRINSSGEVVSGSTGNYVTNYIPCKMDDVIRIKGLNARALSGSNNTSANVLILDAAKTKLRYSALGSETGGHVTVDGDTITVIAGHYNSANYSATAYMRFCGCLLDGYTVDDIVITVNEEITEVEETIVYEWTNTEIPFISIQNIDGNINVDGNVEFVDSIDYCTDKNKLYVLPDGYIYAHMTKEMHTEAPELLDRNACTLNARYSGTVEKTVNGYYITDFIPVDMSLSDPIVLRFKGEKMWAGSGDKLMLFDSSKNVIDTTYIYSDESSGTNLHHEVYEDGEDYCIDLGYVATTGALAKHSSYANIAYIRINQCINSSGTACTIEHVPDVSITIDAMGGATIETGWLNTGHAFVPADYEDRIIAVETLAESNAKKLASISGGNSAASVPSYWQDAVDAAVSKVNALQDAGGGEVVNFLWLSDMHYAPGNSYVSNIGALCAAVMDECDIPLTLVSGDTMSAAVVASEDILLSYLEGAAKVLAPIGHEGLMLIRGNHDDVYGSYTDGDTTVSYVNKAAPNKVWNRLHRSQHKDFRRVFGGDGSYFYLDTPQQVRFVCLNSHFYAGDGITDGTVGAMTGGFGAAQLEWLENTALVVEEGWSVVIATHVPPTAHAVNGNTGYLAQISDGGEFRDVITASAADIIGIFCGHCHADAVVSGDLPCPILTVTCATNSPYDGTAAGRVAGTATETAIDIVSINKASGTISMTRLGAGADRTISY